MLELIAAFTQAGRDLTRPGMLWHALWPPLVALAAWTFVTYRVWGEAVRLLESAIPEVPWAIWAWLAHWAAVFLLLAGTAALAYLTAVLLVAVFALPRLIAIVAARDYPELGRHGENAFWGSLANTLMAGTVFAVGGLLSLPLLLIPGMVLVLPLFWTTWLNQRTFRFDALAEHATRAELRQIVATQRLPLYWAGAGTAVSAHIPLLNLLSPVFTALVFVHLCLMALRRLRQEQGVVVR